MKHLKPDKIKAICEYTINIINKRIKVSDLEKTKISRNPGKIRELVNPRPPQKNTEEILAQEGGAFLDPLLAPILGNLVGHLLKGITEG